MPENEIKKQQQPLDSNSVSQQKTATEADTAKKGSDKDEDDRSDWVEIESGLGIDE